MTVISELPTALSFSHILPLPSSPLSNPVLHQSSLIVYIVERQVLEIF